MTAWRFKMLYDGDCPICCREVSFLKRRDRHGRLGFEDIAAPDFDAAAYGVTREELMASIHGVLPDGRLIKKVAVFREAYRAIGLGWIVAPTAWPGLRWLADRGYDWFARNRLGIGKYLDETVMPVDAPCRRQNYRQQNLSGNHTVEGG